LERDLPNTRRRNIVNWLLGGSVAGLVASVVYPLARFVSPPEVPEAATDQVEAGTTNDPELLEKGFKIVRFGVQPVILIRVAEGDFRAFSATCTHLDCVVEYLQNKKRIHCNCHNGEYDLSGRNVSGPPPRPLKPYTVNIVRKSGGAPSSIVILRS
jgi:cytochrome b6-f complex iron-sulfur subunit